MRCALCCEELYERTVSSISLLEHKVWSTYCYTRVATDNLLLLNGYVYICEDYLNYFVKTMPHLYSGRPKIFLRLRKYKIGKWLWQG